jgi:hypothetical protein
VKRRDIVSLRVSMKEGKYLLLTMTMMEMAEHTRIFPELTTKYW